MRTMEDSYYIFADKAGSFAMAIIMCFAAVMTGFIILKVYAHEWKDYDPNQKKRMAAQVVLPIVLGIAFFLYCYNDSERYKRIWRYGKITNGVTIEKVKPGRSEPYIEYQFIVNNKVYKSDIGYHYDGEYIDSIKVPQGHYRVIYNRKDPTESVMDFKIPAEK